MVMTPDPGILLGSDIVIPFQGRLGGDYQYQLNCALTPYPKALWSGSPRPRYTMSPCNPMARRFDTRHSYPGAMLAAKPVRVSFPAATSVTVGGGSTVTCPYASPA